MKFNQREQIIALTAQWSGERFEDGRPRVPDSLLEALRGMTLEEIWMPLYLKGIDSFFKEIFASILTELKRKGITMG